MANMTFKMHAFTILYPCKKYYTTQSDSHKQNHFNQYYKQSALNAKMTLRISIDKTTGFSGDHYVTATCPGSANAKITKASNGAWQNQLFWIGDNIPQVQFQVFKAGGGSLAQGTWSTLQATSSNSTQPTRYTVRLDKGTLQILCDYQQGLIMMGSTDSISPYVDLTSKTPIPAPVQAVPPPMQSTPQSGRIPLQKVGYQQSYNLFSMWDTHSEGTQKGWIAPKLA